MTDAHDTSPLNQWLTERAGFLNACIVLLCAAIITVSCLRDPVDYDSWWHLKMGQDFVEQGLSPYVDHYSAPFLGQPITNPPVLFQVGYYHLNQWFGERGGQVAFKLICYLALLGLFVLWLRQLKAPPGVRFLVLAILVSVIQARMQVRPELVSYGLTVIAFMLYWRALERFDWRTLLPIAVLTGFWVNYHNPLFGYVVFFGLFVDVGLRQLSERAPLAAWVRWGAWGLLLVALGFLRWEGQHFLLTWLNFAPEWRQEIGEYKAPLAYLGQKATYVWILAALAAVLLTLQQKRWGFLIVLAVFLSGALSMSRMIVPSMVVVLCILAVVGTAAWQPVAAGQQPGMARRMVTGASLLTSLAALFFGFSMALGFLYENRIRFDNVPVAAVDYLESEGLEGNVFNNYRIGGYLLYRLGPEAKVFIDGRTDILYPIDHFLTYKAALNSTERFLEQAERWDIETAILENSESSAHMMADAGFFLDFSGAHFSVYRRGRGRLQELGRLSLYPYCQARFEPEAIVAEVDGGMTRFHKFAMINSVLILANNYYLSDDKRVYLAAVNPDHLLTDPSKRLYAAYAMSHGMPQAAAALLERVDENVPRDFLARLYLMVQRGEDTAARELLRAELVTFADWRFVYERDLEILVLLLRHLDPDGSEALLPAEARSALETSTTLPVEIRSISDLEPEHFCASAPWS